MSSYGLAILGREECEQLLLNAAGRAGSPFARATRRCCPWCTASSTATSCSVRLRAKSSSPPSCTEQSRSRVDAFDVDEHSGWSVNVVGPAEEIVHPEEIARARALDLPAWAGEVRDRFVRIRAEGVTGRRIDAAP